MPVMSNASVTVVYGTCPGGVIVERVVYGACPGGETVERVVQVAEDRLLCVQVRSADRATANSVLDAVQTHGI